MKNKYYNIIIAYFITTLLLALTSHNYIVKYTSQENHSFYHFLLVLFFVFTTPIAFIYLLYLNNKLNKSNVYHLEKTNDELYKSNERYDIVTKATSDTIWDWDIKTGGFIWNKGIQNVFGYKKEDVGKNLQWWFGKIHPEDSLKMSVKLFFYRAKDRKMARSLSLYVCRWNLQICF